MLDQSAIAETVKDCTYDSLALSLARSSHVTLANISHRYNSYSKARDHHAVFAHLYYHSTLQWLSHLEGKEDVHLLYLLIEKFYALYDHHVTQVVDENRPKTAPHWQPYFNTVRKLDASPNSLTMLRVASAGARAHVRYDLADAIIAAALDYQKRYNRLPDLNLARRTHLEAATSKIFERAMFSFTMGETTHIERFLPSNKLILRHSNHMRHLWVPMLQWWRRSAWSDAVKFLAEGKGQDGSLLYCDGLGKLATPKHLH